MRRGIVGWLTLVLALALLGAWRSPAATLAQDDEDLAATVEALERRVADLEARVAALEGQDEVATDVEEPAGSAPTATPVTGDPVSVAEGTRDDPIPLWDSATAGDYTVRVIEVVPNATEAVMAENMFNDPPAHGEQFFMVTVEVTYNGATTGSPGFDLNFQAVGEASVAYSTYDDSCGVVPNDQFRANELFAGGTIRFNVCWSVPSDDVASLVMFVEPSLSFDAEPVFFALRLA